ncbi:hypothetical protein [Mannheimia haemolytica]|uniref:hypothetical protein n=1 Tax=Mannheimia haemolytica TaxID=75985 RepID=UPI0024815D09|nr:hypothetical protein [Mannheimia haemolytica]
MRKKIEFLRSLCDYMGLVGIAFLHLRINRQIKCAGEVRDRPRGVGGGEVVENKGKIIF